MPLNSSHLHHSVIDIIREIPMDREVAPDYPYQTKVDMYDSRCSGCGFCRIEVCPSDIYDAKPIVFNNSKDAVEYARMYGHRINRTCEYPPDVQTRNGKSIYPTLTEIISNTCDLWDVEKISSYTFKQDDEEIIKLIKLLEVNAEK